MKNKNNVQSFYSKNLKNINNIPNEGYLNFGYWKNKNENYINAAKKLLQYIIDNCKDIKQNKIILNVCCGYGVETIKLYENFHPAYICGIDINKDHIEYANKFLKKENIKFLKKDACNIDNKIKCIYDYIIGIEGIAHFNTREKFIKACYNTLKNDGELILTDIVGSYRRKNFNKLEWFIINKCCQLWHYPKSNQITQEEYYKILNDNNLEIIHFEKIGDKVFEGYANHYFYDFKTLFNTIKRMGIFNTLGLIFIGQILKWLYKNGIIEYVFIRAKKLKK
jgi:SAM-dependent methyltransferase